MLYGAVALLGVPAVAAAQNAVLYEVTEAMKITGRQLSQRGATASLMGYIEAGNALCPAAIAGPLARCSVVASANDSVNLGTGQGPVTGKFTVVVQGDNPVDAPELVIATGLFWGRVDLSPALLNQQPLGKLNGWWWAKGEYGGPLAGLGLYGTLEGVFRLPFVFGLPKGCLDDGDPTDCWYVSKPSYWMDQGPVDLAPNEYSLGAPTVRLDLKFTD
jgi:hypothetical protein